MAATSIEWTDAVWNPVTGCRKISPGCKHCYAETIAIRFWGDRKFTDVRLHEDRLAEPLKWRKPRRVFVNSMSDLFHEEVPFDFIKSTLEVMSEAHRKRGHVFQVLTKRPERMLEALTTGTGWYAAEGNVPCPEPGIWLGVSVEDQRYAEERIPWLLRCPAAVRFLSAEPLLGPVDLSHLWLPADMKCWHCDAFLNGEPGRCFCGVVHDPWIQWVIAGGESGGGARPMHPNWVRKIRDDCQEADVAFFFKQWGEWKPLRDDEPDYSDPRDFQGMPADGEGPFCGNLYAMKHNGVRRLLKRIGKKNAGRELDGRTWDEFPVRASAVA